MQRTGGWTTWLAAAGTALLAACGGGGAGSNDRASGSTLTAVGVASSGQVAPAPATAPKVSFYAASRFAEQATFGATPALVAELQAKGFERWIDEQLAMPFVPLDAKPTEVLYQYTRGEDAPRPLFVVPQDMVSQRMLTGGDQLRWRMVWSLSQFIVVSFAAGHPPGWVEWLNLLGRNALGSYGRLLSEVSTDRMMGFFLNNDQNRPKSAECGHCAPNENYARELMQLFSLGVFKLNPDGTPVRDARGGFVETYSQRDVEQLARVLTGWTTDPNPPNRPVLNGPNWGKPMVPTTWPAERDAGAKTVLGRSFPAGQSARKDLQDAVDMLMAHPNIGPFVGLRLIQHLVKSDPSPAYVGRVAAVFRNNGAGVAGDLKAVVKAVLLDPEARRGDVAAQAQRSDGKVREPWLYQLAIWRGLSCQKLPRRVESWGVNLFPSPTQEPFWPASVFSFYAPTDRAPGSNLLAPEQRLLRANEITHRLSLTIRGGSDHRDFRLYEEAGCNLTDLQRAFAAGTSAFTQHLSERYFRGVMPPPLRSLIEDAMARASYDRSVPHHGPMMLLAMALTSPYFGVIK